MNRRKKSTFIINNLPASINGTEVLKQHAANKPDTPPSDEHACRRRLYES
jgi:hypothetical protein